VNTLFVVKNMNKKIGLNHPVTCRECGEKFSLVKHYGGKYKIEEKDCPYCEEFSLRICFECWKKEQKNI